MKAPGSKVSGTTAASDYFGPVYCRYYCPRPWCSLLCHSNAQIQLFYTRKRSFVNHRNRKILPYITAPHLAIFPRILYNKPKILRKKGLLYELNVSAGIFLLPDLEQEKDPTEATRATEETAPPEDIPSLIWIYRARYRTCDDIGFDLNNDYHYIERAWYACYESIWQGLRFDKDYRIEEIGTHWAETKWEDPAPGTGMEFNAFNASYSMHHGNLANYLLRAFPYTEMVLNHQWDVGTGQSAE